MTLNKTTLQFIAGCGLTVLAILFPSFAANNLQPIDKLKQASKYQPATQRRADAFAKRNNKYWVNQQIAALLNWIPTKGTCNLCAGYYQEPPILLAYPEPLPPKRLPTRISAEGPTTFTAKGVSVLHKNVVTVQPGRILTADTAYIYRNKKTGKITAVKLIGHVHLMEHGKLIVAHSAILNLAQHTLRMHDAIYHLSEKTIKSINNAKLTYDAFGKAKRVYRDENKILHLWSATYTTCSPLNPAWTISASFMKLDKKKNKGVAHNVVVRFKQIPIFYTPYFQFPLKNQRKTGFLTPWIGYSTANGFQLETPFYWNMAPNYDFTFTPFYLSKRGVQFNGLFRFLSPNDVAGIYLSYLPNDRGFSQFRNENLANTPATSATLPYLNQFSNFDNDRLYAHINNSFNYHNLWQSDLFVNYVSDPYYFKDFGNAYAIIRGNQLLNQFDIRYNGMHWQAMLLLQAYQTLHLINQIETPPNNQYSRLPEFDLGGYYPHFLKNLDFVVSGQIVNFNYSSSFPPLTFQQPIGQRLHWRPLIRSPFYFASGYFIPTIGVDYTSYFAKLQTISPGINRPGFNQGRALPIFDIDSGIYLHRLFYFYHSIFLQTLEPRIFYLYIPFENQNRFPNFDTQVLPFTFTQLFEINRFAGFDRLNNANQISFALTSRILREDNGAEILNFGLGMIYYITPNKVLIPPINMPNSTSQLINPIQGHTSPLIGHINYYPTPNWSLVSQAAWDVQNDQFDNAQLGVEYHQPNNFIAIASYNFVKEINGIPFDAFGLSNNTEYVTLGGSIPFIEKWRLVAYWYYNVSKHRTDGYFAGFEYSTCCWAARFVVDRSFTGVKLIDGTNNMPSSATNQFRTTYYFQLMLKGLGNVGKNNANYLLQTSLPGYRDSFTNG